MSIDKKEREDLIKKISKASGIAQYALDKKMSDGQVEKAAQYLVILELIKDANHYNRYCQGQKTKEANEKLKEFLKVENSEIVKTGRWLLSALSKTGSDRKKTLLEKGLVHKEDYNDAVGDMNEAITKIGDHADESLKRAEKVILDLQHRIDILKDQMSQIQKYISTKYGPDDWKSIQQRFKV